ncbi:hypothetical protein D3C83_247700 [compost metagenome]
MATKKYAVFGVVRNATSAPMGSANIPMKKVTSTGGNNTAFRSRVDSSGIATSVKKRWCWPACRR